MPKPLVIMITDRKRYHERDDLACEALVGAAGRAARAGADIIQVRERGLDDIRLLTLAEGVREVASPAGAATLINDRLDVALAARAAGVHLPARGFAASRVRAAAPPGFLIGRSVHSDDEAIQAQAAGGCDYLIFGSVFETASKAPGHRVAGLDALARVCESVDLPVVAVGGITVDRIPDVARAGAAGIAAISLFASGEEPTLGEIVRGIRRGFGVN